MDISSQYRFDSFAEGESSRLAYAACKALVEEGELHGNPLVLIGGTGLGKTHLLHSIANALRTKNPELKMICSTALEFYEEYGKKVLLKKENNPEPLEEMAMRHRNADIFILDDFQNIQGKIRSQHELLQIFNTLLLAGKPVVTASQLPISDMESLNESLRSRLTSGLTIQISQPALVDRLAILRKKFDMIGFKIDENVLLHLAEKTSGTASDLVGIVSNIKFKVMQSNKNADLEMATEVLEEHFSNSHRTLTMESIVKNVAEAYGISVEILKLKGRGSKEAVLTRQIAMYFIRSLLKKSFEHIGKYFNRDHSTALYACKSIEEKIRKEMPFNLEIKKLQKALFN
ncbi:MAG: AAA family ATPase [Fibromonadaceae bacterium]|jgi:chromosomal replication initiator protein|nr:AAA family ATPase [Fibromonadaceae bacterium]